MRTGIALPRTAVQPRSRGNPLASLAYAEGGKRDRRLDLLRGYCVVAMTVDHLDAPTWLYLFTGGNRFFVSAAEGFLFISGLVMGIVYRPIVERQGLTAAALKAMKRALLLYGVTVAATLGFMWVSARFGLPWAAGVHVGEAVPEVLELRRTFYLTDVLLLYTFLIAIAPIAFWLLRRGWTWVLLGASWGVWAAHQIHAIDMPWPSEDGAFFYIAAWQVLFFTALAIGWHRDALTARFGRLLSARTLLASGIGLALLLVLWRWGPLWAGQYVADGGAAISEAFAKWNLPPARLIACAIVFTFAFSIAHFLWRPVVATVGRILLPLGGSALTAYVLQLMVVACLAAYRQNIANVQIDSRVRGSAFQVLAVLSVWLLLNGWVGLRHLIARMTSERSLERRLDPALGAAFALLLALGISLAPVPVQNVGGFVHISNDSATVDQPYYLLHVPPNAAQQQPLPVLVVLHDIGEDPESFGDALIALADRDGWVLVAPQLPYEPDYLDPWTVASESPRMLRGLRDTIGQLANDTGLRLRRRVTLFGYGRGASAAERYALAYPEDVRAVALLGGGGYTLPPVPDGPNPQFPFGVSGMVDRFGRPVGSPDLRRISFWVGVGDQDRSPNDTSRAWDQYMGRTRVERAETLAGALRVAGAPTELHIFPDVGHAINEEIRAEVAAFAARDREAGPSQPPRQPRGERSARP